uniref:TetR/AcrR family transcriptional regulator n=1 Tax=Bordetella sputigena TaxID=1416810 RepID=UPI0039EF5126
MRDRIKEVATALLITNGYNGTSFRDIATKLDITTTNIHYHFGNKQSLVDELVKEYVDSAIERHREIWLDENLSLPEKLRRVVEYNHSRYKRFNRTGHGGKSWSLIGRLRLESEVLSDAGRADLERFTDSIHEAIQSAVRQASDSGELRADTPRDDLAFLLINIVNSSSVFTQGTGGFDRLELFFDAFSRVMLSAYAGKHPAAKKKAPTKAARG